MPEEVMPGEDNAMADVASGDYKRHFKILPGHVVLDLGAHVGYFSERVASRGAEVIAFEPHPENFARLSRRAQISTIAAINKAAADDDCVARLFECPTNSGAHSLRRHDQCVGGGVWVGQVDIGKWLDRLGLAPDFIKVDTEGSEVKILESLFSYGVRVPMAVETHSDEHYDRCLEACSRHEMKWWTEGSKIGICYCEPND